MITLYTDENVDGAITRQLRVRGVDVLTVQEDSRSGLKPDSLVMDRATDLDRVLFSQDTDLLVEAARRMAHQESFSGLIYAHKQVAVGVCVENLELMAQAGRADEYRDWITYIP